MQIVEIAQNLGYRHMHSNTQIMS